jgi:hypothetical protein
MKVIHIILAHNKNVQLKMLLEALTDIDSFTFVHLDKKCNLADFAYLTTFPGVRLVKERIVVNWGGFSQVKAIMASITEVVNSGLPFDYLNLLSGQDYPVKSARKFTSFLSSNKGKIFFEYHLPGHPWLEDTKIKINDFHLTDYRFRGSYRIERIINKLFSIKLPNDFEIIGHSTWFTIDTETALFLVAFFADNAKFIRKFRFTWGADEYLIPSVIYNSHLRHKLVNNNLRYIDWSEGNDSPKTLTRKDEKALASSDSFFARKFNIELDKDILNQLNRILV